MGTTALLYGAATFAVFYFCSGVAVLGPRRLITPAACSVMLMVTWFVSNMTTLLVGRPYDIIANFPMDLICGLIVLGLFIREPQTWKAALALCFLTQALSHVWFVGVSEDRFWADLLAGRGYEPLTYLGDAERRVGYRTWLNAVYILELVTVTMPGALYVGSVAGGWVRRRAVRRGLAVSRQERD